MSIPATWRRDYNEVRPHSSLGNRTPSAFASALRDQGTLADQSPSDKLTLPNDIYFGRFAVDAAFTATLFLLASPVCPQNCAGLVQLLNISGCLDRHGLKTRFGGAVGYRGRHGGLSIWSGGDSPRSIRLI